MDGACRVGRHGGPASACAASGLGGTQAVVGLIGAGILIIGQVRSRSATANLSELIEAVVDLHARELADSIKMTGDTYTDPDVGQQINRFVQKRRWDPTSVLAD